MACEAARRSIVRTIAAGRKRPAPPDGHVEQHRCSDRVQAGVGDPLLRLGASGLAGGVGERSKRGVHRPGQRGPGGQLGHARPRLWQQLLEPAVEQHADGESGGHHRSGQRGDGERIDVDETSQTRYARQPPTIAGRSAPGRWMHELAAWQRQVDTWLEDLAAKGRAVAEDMDAARSTAKLVVAGAIAEA